MGLVYYVGTYKYLHLAHINALVYTDVSYWVDKSVCLLT